MFGNEIHNIVYKNEIIFSNHTILKTFSNLEDGQIGLLVLIGLLFIGLFVVDLYALLRLICPNEKPDTNMIENLNDWPRCFT